MQPPYFASGKLLLFGEFLVLRGSRALAVPLLVGQKLSVFTLPNDKILWRCFDKNGRCWLKILFSEDLEILETANNEEAFIVKAILLFIKKKKKDLSFAGLYFEFKLEFSRQFGFGTSSTLLSLLSQWSGISAYELSGISFHTSGYDIAAATAKQPFIYSMEHKLEKYCSLPDNITQNLLFVFSGDKQATSKRVALFHQYSKDTIAQVQQMNQIVSEAARCSEIEEWEILISKSENLIAPLLQMQPIKEQYFSDYPYTVKSLGAWGGDFIMATCRNIKEGKKYFQQRGQKIIFTFEELIKQD